MKIWIVLAIMMFAGCGKVISGEYAPDAMPGEEMPDGAESAADAGEVINDDPVVDVQPTLLVAEPLGGVVLLDAEGVAHAGTWTGLRGSVKLAYGAGLAWLCSGELEARRIVDGRLVVYGRCTGMASGNGRIYVQTSVPVPGEVELRSIQVYQPDGQLVTAVEIIGGQDAWLLTAGDDVYLVRNDREIRAWICHRLDANGQTVETMTRFYDDGGMIAWNGQLAIAKDGQLKDLEGNVLAQVNGYAPLCAVGGVEFWREISGAGPFHDTFLRAPDGQMIRLGYQAIDVAAVGGYTFAVVTEVTTRSLKRISANGEVVDLGPAQAIAVEGDPLIDEVDGAE